MEVLYINLLVIIFLFSFFLFPSNHFFEGAKGIGILPLMERIQKIGAGVNILTGIIFLVIGKYNLAIYSFLWAPIWLLFFLLIIFLGLFFNLFFSAKLYPDFGYVSQVTYWILRIINFFTFGQLRKYLRKRNQRIRNKYIKPHNSTID